ncbi:type VI secretion system baseplate subunit TssE [Burkholderia stagnalis]|uniref:type VI secretion system baseplate subunit TssE n=1 Tax=Burkholderia stagnalis TaxID=1503054 RepID=UPI000755A0B4|nr:type VI secretion system baseplate subunit TssE [Burkholderia stagnalis]KVO63766.1 cytoplasmic protein [Burkholderia stagnalis]KVP14315.1 cytoplasmic protein [Burkholderia stagnalis]KVW94826.1 cytoplasmic protein [Burkholderia stagnalis]KWH79648.1 cytoplasmic protein [Burkholderia stagnalis]
MNTPTNPPENVAPVPGDGAPAPRRANAHLLPTLLDRLRDDAPQRQSEAPGEYAVTRTQMRGIVQRDLAFLLNAMSIDGYIDRESHPEAAASTVNFGMPPLAGVFMASRKWAEIERTIRRVILDFEPRLIPETLVVAPSRGAAAGERGNVLAFEVRGMIRMDAYPIEFMVQSALDLETSQVSVTGMRAR